MADNAVKEECFEEYLPDNSATAKTIARDCRLVDLTVTRAVLNGKWIPNRPDAHVERVIHCGSEMRLQLQARERDHLKCVHVVLRQNGNDVVAYAEKAACATPDHEYGCDLSKDENCEHFEGLKVATGAQGEAWNGYGVEKLYFKRSPLCEIEIKTSSEISDSSLIGVMVRPLVDVSDCEVLVGLHWVKEDDSYGGFLLDRLLRPADDGWLRADYAWSDVARSVMENEKSNVRDFLQERRCRFFPVVFATPDGDSEHARFRTDLLFSIEKKLLAELQGREYDGMRTLLAAWQCGYWVVRNLGRGAMGEIWEVEDKNLQGPHLALKTFNPMKRENLPELQERFGREARVLHEISHDVVRSGVRLPRIHRYVKDLSPGNPFYVMDLVVGPKGKPCNLGEMRREEYRDLFDEEHMAVWFEDICRELIVLHRQHCLHRDIKPENILLDEDGHAVLADFGTANVKSGDFAQNEVNDITMVGRFEREAIGTRRYWAPELGNGKAASERSDIYALAVTFWNLLFDEPFGAECFPPEREQFADWARAGVKWFKTLKRMLAPNPKDRFGSVEECLKTFKGTRKAI